MTKVIFSFLILASLSCQFTSPNGAEENNIKQSQSFATEKIPEIEVRIEAVKKSSFPIFKMASGILKARENALLKTGHSGILKTLSVKEGQFFKKNTLLAQLDTAPLQLQLEQARMSLEEAVFNKNDQLVLQGGEWAVDTSVSSEALKNINIQSGYNKAQHGIKQLEYELEQTKILAPFDGIAADVAVKAFQYVTTGEPLFRLINPATFEAEFELLEKEALQISTGQRVKVLPLALPQVQLWATVSAINPVVDEQGLVRLHARIRAVDLKRYRGSLFEGMNLQVVVERRIPNQLVIPKQAVVLRSGREVVFTYSAEEGVAKWHYVTIVHENDAQLAIGEGLKEGDLVIYEGNLNLDHDAEVVVIR